MTVSRYMRFGAEVITKTYAHRVVDAFGDLVKYLEDFVNSPSVTDNITGWTTTLVEAGAGESTVTLGDETGGILVLTTDAATNDGINMQRPPESFRVDNNSFYFGIRCKVVSTTATSFFVGLSVTDTAILTNLGKRIGFSKSGTSAIPSFDMKKTNTTSLTGLPTMVNDTYQTFEFLYDKPAGKLSVYVDGAEVAVLTNLVDIPDTELQPSIHFKTTTTVAKIMNIDWIRVVQFGRL